MTKPTAIFERWSIVAVPFPFVEGNETKRRPALVLSNRELALAHGLYFTAMITSAANEPWDDDVRISDLAAAGLPNPSVVRAAKIMTVAEAQIVRRLGQLTVKDRAAVTRILRRFMP